LDPKLLLRKYEAEINDLKLELKMHDTLKGRGTVDYDPSPDEIAHMDKKIKQYLTGDPDVDAKTLCSDATTIRHHKLMFEMFKEQYEKREQEIRERQAMRTDGGAEGGMDGGAAAEDLAPDEPGGVGDEMAGADAGFSLGFAGENNRPPEGDDEGMEETHSPKEAAETGMMPPKVEKQEMFVTFKETKEQGREIEGRFKQLKADLKDAKSTLAKLAQEVNATKREIDAAQLELDRTVGAKGAAEEGIIDNDEWESQKKLREKKKAYRENIDQHTQQRRMIEDFEVKIKQTKVDLVNAFEGWWQQNYGSTQRDGDAGGVLDDLQDIGEQFDSMELDRLERIHPSGAVPFYKARKEFRLHHGTRTLRQ
jgi:kinesin family protein 6/9